MSLHAKRTPESLRSRGLLRNVYVMQERGLQRRFPASMRLKGATSFQRVFRRGRVRSLRLFSLHVLRQPGVTRVGVVVPRRWGSAVERNRIRRLVREVIRLHREVFADAEFIVRPTEHARQCSFWDLERELLSAFTAGRRSEARDEERDDLPH